MAIPFIAVAAGAGAFVGGGKVIDTYDTMERAKEINREAQRIGDNSTKKRDRTRKSTNDTLAELGKTKLSIMAGSIRDFVENYKRIRNRSGRRFGLLFRRHPRD